LIVIACNAVRYVGTKTENIYGIGSGQIWLDKTRCNGTEKDIDDCSHDLWGVHSCGHNEDVAISCTTGKPNVLYCSLELPAIFGTSSKIRKCEPFPRQTVTNCVMKTL